MKAETISLMPCRCPHRESLSQTVRKEERRTHTLKENFRFLSSMKIIWRLLRVCVFALLVNPFAEASVNVITEKLEVVRSDFPRDFMFGTATSAVQIEESANGVRGPSVWDSFAHNFSAKFADHSTGDIAINSYERYKAEGSFFLYIYPEGLQKLLEYIKDRYQNPKIYITENGINEAMVDGLEEALHDPH
ncbi:beta-glucosidase 24 [Vitis vinifera]|uniref:beta-glucosidase 24 n=1 Tax=Vitis vinifera TaxID=29760 RepID=UPI00053FE8C3|nr:beta-glucosidase 24 [Vitis vinifera]XP_059590104.1 beta-glucosidase 24 [Vitis vinifera]|eukprot:XP_010663726.1 PREDICTED: beta-glucosidase 24 isoform X1 [Vitis vinifera]